MRDLSLEPTYVKFRVFPPAAPIAVRGLHQLTLDKDNAAERCRWSVEPHVGPLRLCGILRTYLYLIFNNWKVRSQRSLSRSLQLVIEGSMVVYDICD